MATKLTRVPITCPRCIRARNARLALAPTRRCYSDQTPLKPKPDTPSAEAKTSSDPENSGPPNDEPADGIKGAMSRRLEQATEDALLTGGTSGRRAVEDAGFSEELKERLLDKVRAAEFQRTHASAISIANASTASRSAPFSPQTPWEGTESQSDAVLRMLDDARKPLKPGARGTYRVPDPVDLRPRPQVKMSAGQRAANARERAGMYAGMGMKEKGGATPEGGVYTGRTEEEREEYRQELRERFSPGARAVGTNVSALAALANRRIDEAVARGAFKDIPRGKDAAPRDTRADNPFIDTTEYLMNKMIQRQDIVPPWIEKQQEVARTAASFRGRLRNDWRRHASRMISSRGGALEEQVRRAEGYAVAEARVNPRRRVAAAGVVSGISTDDAVFKIKEDAAAGDLASAAAVAAAASAAVTAEVTTADSSAAEVSEAKTSTAETSTPAGTEHDEPAPNPYAAAPFRDPEWEKTENAYMTLAIENLNKLTRSYNLMAPELAKKPYFSLERELNACYADVAPLLAETIRERATRPTKSMMGGEGPVVGSVFERFGNAGGTGARVYESKAPRYGFKEMWRDLWKRSDAG